MSIKPTLLILAIFAMSSAYAQQASLKGTVTDSVEKKNPENAVISLLHKSDSVLVKFDRADKQGKFEIKNIPVGKYIIMVTHPYMGDYYDTLELTSEIEKDLGQVYMTPKAKLLEAVLVKSGNPIRIKGDTTVYTADSFKVRPGANVEELLRRLPGIQVDKDGKITAMGETVQKVLVDGEEFFGSDPGIATKNLRADGVKEVEVFDKKSDQAEFTGIDDGVKDKTINLKMKKKEGYFGKIELAGGIKDKYNNALMLNSFKNKRKLAGYAIMSNTGQTNLDWDDANNYGGGMENVEMEDGGMYFTSSSDDDESFWGGRGGIPQNWNGGLHYSDKFGKDQKQSFNSGYKFSKINAPANSNTFSRIFLPDTSWSQNSSTNSSRSTIKHAVNLTIDANLDSANSLKWTIKANKKDSRNYSDFYSEALANNGGYINNSTRSSNNTGDNSAINTTLLWRHKFKKPSRTISVDGSFNWSNSSNKGFLYSLNKYYSNGILNHIDTTDQLNDGLNATTGFSTKVAYTEPLAKDFYMELSHSIAWYGNNNDRLTYRKNNTGKYIDVVDSLSNSFAFNRLVNTPGINFRMNKRKYNYSFGTGLGFSTFNQKDLTNNTDRSYNYVNFFPRAALQYKFKPSQSFRFNYNGASNAPTLEQLQPIRVNTDPLNIYIGNPNLKQSFRHSFNLGYNSFNTLKQKYIYSNANFSVSQNAFVQSSQIDDVGRRIYQTVNSNGSYYLNLYTGINYTLKNKMGIGFGPNINTSRNINFINGLKNISNNSGYGIRLDINKDKENKYNIYFSPSFSLNKSSATINKTANVNYWQIRGYGAVRLTILKKYEFEINGNSEFRQKDPRFSQNNNFTKLNSSITRRFLKENKMEVKFSVNDLLDQNRGYDRNFDSYSFTENYYTTLRRFYLLTFTWNISKNGKAPSDN